MERKVKITENEKKHTLGRKIWGGKMKKVENLEMSTVDMEYGKKTDNHGKWETYTWQYEKMTKSLKKEKNEKCTL